MYPLNTKDTRKYDPKLFYSGTASECNVVVVGSIPNWKHDLFLFPRSGQKKN